jgi:hypothetical protein
VHFKVNVCCLAGLLIAATATAAAAQITPQEPAPASPQDAAPGAAADMKAPRVLPVNTDWNAARTALAGFAPLMAHDSSDAAAADSLVRLNAATKKVFPSIALSSVPVLLPFDTAAFLRDDAGGMALDNSKYFFGFDTSSYFFLPGPGGYDASFSLQPQSSTGLDLAFGKRVDVQISASAVLYDLDVAATPQGSPVAELQTQFPGIRRLFVENHVRYAFVRFGVPYSVTVMCHDGSSRARRLSCGKADKVGIYFLKALNIVGGAPQPSPSPSPQTIDRPANKSADFTYFAPGDILPGTGMHGQGGRADATVYSNIRFPMAGAPAYVNSQTFMNWGNCDFTGRVTLGGRGKDATYRCRVNSLTLVKDESKNYAYPWRDNFCEHRYFAVGQCPAGLGHQGEDIRPGSCKLRNAEADRCEPYEENVVAAHDGTVLRSPGDEALYLVVNRPGEHIRFRYLHMDPRLLDAAGMVSGRVLAAGEVIGAVDDYQDFQGGTTDHLHFDVQVPTRDGWVFVNPYMTLVASYEHLIGARGAVVNDAMFAPAPVVAATPPVDGQAANTADHAGAAIPNSAAIATSNPAEMPVPQAPGAIVERQTHPDRLVEEPRSTRERGSRSAEHCQTRVAKGHRGRHCGTDVAEGRERAGHAHAVRSVDRRVSRESNGARHHGPDVHERHAHGTSRHGRA